MAQVNYRIIAKVKFGGEWKFVKYRTMNLKRMWTYLLRKNENVAYMNVFPYVKGGNSAQIASYTKNNPPQ